jgi:DNA mismatch endonuclease (patch repair protein)
MECGLRDFLTPAERSERMARIRSRDTLPELALRRALHRLGLRFRVNVKTLPGKPDIVFARYRTALFVHGCFWHRHDGCKVASNPKSNVEFWQGKFARNVSRDRSVRRELSVAGWRVIVVWECQLNTKSRLEQTAMCLAKEIKAQT